MPAEKKRNGQKIVSRRITGMGGRRSEMQKRYIDLHTDTASAVFDRKKSLEANGTVCASTVDSMFLIL